MRVLCLHGRGTSAAIFKSQTATFRAHLPKSYTFDFVDGPFPCAPYPGIDTIFRPARGHYFRAWWTEPTPEAIRAAHRWLDNYIARHGPYDSVMCFSQGCSLVASYLLYHADERGPDVPPPFGSAVFICGGLPFEVLEDLGVEVSARAHEISAQTSRLLRRRAGLLTEFAAGVGTSLWDDKSGLVHDADRRVLPDPSDCFGLDFGQVPAHLRITIPTVHVYGARDPRCPASIQLSYFCREAGHTRMYDHGGGHDIPRSTVVSKRLAELVSRNPIKQTVQRNRFSQS
ncbi:serine hydrolase FSH [Dichotomopilus funicola]|uniref:Serine hydrolase FSH n=1 Tax=Dichotomopilus funicola TaxID=1934379 RepID=A0AAN6VB24_9PEZI|nr:serine hydrolase FSH [Dichotomopilus funicola]